MSRICIKNLYEQSIRDSVHNSFEALEEEYKNLSVLSFPFSIPNGLATFLRNSLEK
jgi:hypothetical protein